MPTYVYECQSCERTFEIQQRMSEGPLSDCECGANGSLRRLIQPVGVIFNGPGFHINDYAGASKPAEPVCTGEPKSCPSCASTPPTTD